MQISHPVKTSLFTVLYTIVSNIAVGLCFVPFLLLCWKKMRKEKAYRIVGIYWLANGLMNLPNFYLFEHFALQEELTLAYNLLSTPLLLLLFYYATSKKNHKTHILTALLLFIVLESVLVIWKGYSFRSSAMIIGVGLLLILTYSITGLVQYMKEMEHTPFENSMVFIYAALLFAYVSFMIIYIFNHIHSGHISSNSRDSFLIYYIGLLSSAAITCMGLWGYGLRRPIAGPYSSSSS